MNYTTLDHVFQDIEKEISYARSKWGVEFDDRNTLNDWLAYTITYASRAAEMDRPPKTVRPLLVKAAGLLISAIERLDANGNFPPRHYDK